MDADIIVVGAGLAGLMAARAACAHDARVLLLTRKTVGLATNSAISNGVFAGPTSDYGAIDYVRETLRIGKRLNSRPHVQAAALGIGPAMAVIRQAGCDLVEGRGFYQVKPARADLIPGVTLMKRVAAGVRGLRGLSVEVGFYATRLVSHGGRVCGVAGYDRQGRDIRRHAPAVVLAGGGAGAIYLRNDNQRRALGQGYAMALRAGLALRDMEFVQFYPFVLAEPGLPEMLLYPPVPKNARLINTAGQDLAEKFGLGSLNEMIMKKRDDLSILLHEEMRSGPVLMDYRGVAPDRWAHPPLAMLAKLKFDFQRKPFAVAPGAHFCMGGIATDAQTWTALPGLFACGEVAWGLHGANRRGGNALSECMVFGSIAGEAASRWAMANPLPTACRQETSPRAGFPDRPLSRTSLRPLSRSIREIACQHAGLVRSDPGLRSGEALLREVEAKVRTTDPGNLAETLQKHDLLGACLVLRAIFAASLAREESVGSFKRADFPEEKDQSGYGNSSVYYDAAADRFSVSFIQNPKETVS